MRECRTLRKKRGLSVAKTVGSGIAWTARTVTRAFGPYYGARIAGHAASRLAPVISVTSPRGLVYYQCVSANVVKHARSMMTRERDTIDWISEYIGPNDHVWDVGANIGVYSLYAALARDVTVTAFEPVASNFAILTDAIMRNGLSNRVTPLAMALSDATGTVPIYLIDSEPGTGLHALNEPVNARGAFAPQGKIMVPAIRGDDVTRHFSIRPPTHIKIDVDGHEMRVLEGMRQTLLQARSVWIEMMEETPESISTNDSICAWLSAHGFEPAALKSGVKGENRLFVNRKV